MFMKVQTLLCTSFLSVLFVIPSQSNALKYRRPKQDSVGGRKSPRVTRHRKRPGSHQRSNENRMKRTPTTKPVTHTLKKSVTTPSRGLYATHKTSRSPRRKISSAAPQRNPVLLNDRIDSELIPRMKEGKRQIIEGENGVPIHTIRWEVENPTGKIVIFNGKRESYLRYAEFISDLRTQYPTHSIYTYDHRGQGISSRLLKENYGHVEKFDHYVKDAAKVMESVVKPEDGVPIIGYGHSMGGGVLAKFHLDNPGVFKGLMFSSPMWAITFYRMRLLTSLRGGHFESFLDKSIEQAVLFYATLRGNNPILIGKTNIAFDEVFPKDNKMTGSPERYHANTRLMTEYGTQFGALNDDVTLGDPTWRWIRENIKATRNIRKRAHEFQDTPMVIVNGTLESVVSTKAHKKICEASNNCTLVSIKNGLHETQFGVDRVRKEHMDSLQTLIDKVLNSTSRSIAKKL